MTAVFDLGQLPNPRRLVGDFATFLAHKNVNAEGFDFYQWASHSLVTLRKLEMMDRTPSGTRINKENCECENFH
jgi:hypothetical protein